MAARRIDEVMPCFLTLWTAKDSNDACFIVWDKNRHALATAI
jgi:hypothetical protein